MVRDPKSTGEAVLIWTYNLKPEVNLLGDFQIQQWIRNYFVGNCKLIIGEAREKFATIAGPQSGTSLNGTQMKAEGMAMMQYGVWLARKAGATKSQILNAMDLNSILQFFKRTKS